MSHLTPHPHRRRTAAFWPLPLPRVVTSPTLVARQATLAEANKIASENTERIKQNLATILKEAN